MIDVPCVVNKVNSEIRGVCIKDKGVEKILDIVKRDLEYFIENRENILKQTDDLDSKLGSGRLNRIVEIAIEYDGLTKVINYIESLIAKVNSSFEY